MKKQSMATTASLDVVAVTKIYNHTGQKPFVAVNNVSFHLNKGDVLGLIGHNGAGKTTLIKIITSIMQPTSGEVKICNISLGKNPTAAKYHIGFVNQEISLDTYFTVQQILELQSLYYGIVGNNSRINYLLQLLELKHKANTLTRHLSGGMKRRLMIARALIHDPDIIILDEPTAGVDLSLRNRIMHCILELQAQGKIVILTTHHFDEVEQLCNVIMAMNHGEITFFDTKNSITNTLSNNMLEIHFDTNNNKLAIQQCFKSLINNNNTTHIKSNSIQIPNNQQFISQILEIAHQNSLSITSISENSSPFKKAIENLMQNPAKVQVIK